MNVINVMHILDKALFAYFGFCVFYLFLFAFFSRFKRGDRYPVATRSNRFAVIFPAYKEDSVIFSSVQAFLRQEYPREYYDIVVISDHMSDVTNEKLAQIPVLLFKAGYENSSKAKALNFAVDCLKGRDYDVIVIMDADNTAEPDFLVQINRAYSAGAMAIQAHRKGKNFNTDVAVLDAASEEMNNAYFRKGHVFLGLSAALSGSGMAFDARWFRENIGQVSSAGEDKELEILLLKQRIYIEYLNDVPVYDEKVQNSSAFYRQRRRWLAAQFGSLKKALRELPCAIYSQNIDYIDKLIQWMMLPRVLLLGLIFLVSFVLLILHLELSLKWWTLFLLLMITFGLAIPKDIDNEKLEKALIKIPLLFVMMFINLFRMKGINKKFIHTTHEHE